MACFEDALSPTFANVLAGQLAVRGAARGALRFTSPEGKRYELEPDPAVLHVRPRGWHLDERHLRVEGEPVAAALADAGLFLFHNAAALLERGSGPYLYLPKLESRLEARLWCDVLRFAEDRLGLPSGSVRVTVLIETLPAAFEMDEILFELRDHICALNAGRWDYLFSAIKSLREAPGVTLPDRDAITMTVPFMRSYTELLVRTCHRRGAHAIGGMAAFVPNRRDAVVTERALAAVQDDKRREAGDGFDGTWVAHPDLVPVARQEFDAVLRSSPNQLERLRGDVRVEADDLLALGVPGARATERGLRANVAVAIQYIASWLEGTGAVAIDNLMEDAATAEIARAQVWQWVRHGAELEGLGRLVETTVRRVLHEELEKLGANGHRPALTEAAAIFERVALERPLRDFLTLEAYDRLA
jgi:malate synthase